MYGKASSDSEQIPKQGGNVSTERLLSMCYTAKLKNVYSESLDLKCKMEYGRNLGRE